MAEIEISVECSKCGATLDVTVKRRNDLLVVPCEDCMLENYNDGFDTAKKED